MTTPGVLTAGVKELINRSQELGISWRIVPASVSDPATMLVLVDGDTTAIYATNMTGIPLAQNQRVYMLLTPPAGNFVIGIVGTSALLDTTGQTIGFVAAQTDTGSIGTGGTTVLTIALPVAFATGRAYEVSFGGQMFASATTNTGHFNAYVSPGGAGNDLVQYGGYGPSTSADPIATYGFGVVVNAGPSLLIRQVNLFAASSAGTITWRGNAFYPRFLRVVDIGSATLFPNAHQVP